MLRRSFLVGRPVPRARSTKPLILLISSNSYCSGVVTFSRISGTNLAPIRFSIACKTLNEYVTGGFYTCITTPGFIILDGFS